MSRSTRRANGPAQILSYWAIVVIVSVIAMLNVPGSLFPPEDESRIVASVELPPGSTLDDTAATTDAMRDVVKDIDGVKSVLVIGGSTPLGDRDTRRATFTIVLDRLDNGLERKLIDLGRALPLIGGLIPEIPSHGRLRPQHGGDGRRTPCGRPRRARDE